MANFRLNNRHLPVFLAVGVCHVSNNSSLCFQTLQDLKSNNKREKWESIFFESKNVSFLPAGKCVCAMSMHIFQMMMKERFKSALKMKEMSVFLSGFISLNSGVFYFFVPPIHLSLLAHRYSDPHSAVGSQSPWLSGVIFTQRRPLIGSQWCSKDFGGEIETNRLDFTEVVVLCRPALTNYLVGNLILNIQGLNR